MSFPEQEMEPLARLAGEGDRQAFGQLLALAYVPIFRMAYRQVEDRQDAEEICQEVCLHLSRAILSFRGESTFATWLYRVVINAVHDFRRKNVRHANHEVAEEVLAELPSPYGNPEQALISSWIRRCVAALPEALRQAVVLVHGEGLLHRQVGEILGCKEGTISWRLSEARKLLARCLDREKKP
ncbi:MAG: RNA polymerase sigma factor [Magnetococcales bacterium]|nr:RNA polymerase sigma factor [Magnetococcales bacterium]NGZ26695.1 RNA polymerase sigma factor [Magnetococcales bacterium]